MITAPPHVPSAFIDSIVKIILLVYKYDHTMMAWLGGTIMVILGYDDDVMIIGPS